MMLENLADWLNVVLAEQVSGTITIKHLVHWLTVLLTEQVSGTVMGCCRSGWVGGQ